MKSIPPVFFALALQSATVSATEQIITLGDSLTYAYEAEFGFKKTITGIPGTVGDGMPATVLNWIEILIKPVYRGDRFDLGNRDNITVDPPFDPPFDLYFRQSHNWAIPGLKVDELRRFITGDPTATFSSFVSSSSTLGTLFSYSDFSDATDFALPDLENQITTTAERLTLFIGGNDVKAVYGDIYNGLSAGSFVADFMADTVAILDRVQALNPNIQIVVVNVPHIGITLDVSGAYPYDVVKTERVSAVLRDLNGQLASLAAARKIGYADIYDATLQMLDGTKLAIHGVTFVTANGTSLGSLDTVWLNGPISANFHPNTNGQAVIANEIIHAFNRRYQTGIPLLTATEVLGGLLAKTAAVIDVQYPNWSQRYYPAPTRPASDDSDRDGIPAGTEYALGLNPLRRDADYLSSGVVGGQLEIAYPRRLPSSTRFTLTPESSATLASPFTPMAPPLIGADGLYRARLPVSSSPGFLRLKTVVN